MASFPTFDPTLLVRGMTQEEYNRRFGEAKNNPLINRAIQGLYPPGSTYKPFVALSGLRRGLLTVGDYYPCPSVWEVPGPNPLNEHFDNWSSADFGSISLAQALYDSCDTVFYPLGFRYWQRWYPTQDDEEPALPMQQDLRAIGFGKATGIDLPYEFAGRVPDPEWKRTFHRTDPVAFPDGETYPGDFILMTIGQGDTLVTPLQLATGFAGLANDGKMCWPHLVDRVLRPDGDRRIKPRCGGKSRTMPFSAASIRYVRDALTKVPTDGTAIGAFRGFPLSQVSVAGKTGTAEIDYPPGTDDYSWFAAIADDGTQEYVVVAVVEQGGHGSTTAAPIVRRIIEGIYGIEPSGFIRGEATD
jgi:penicillin-binding protein 2